MKAHRKLRGAVTTLIIGTITCTTPLAASATEKKTAPPPPSMQDPADTGIISKPHFHIDTDGWIHYEKTNYARGALLVRTDTVRGVHKNISGTQATGCHFTKSSSLTSTHRPGDSASYLVTELAFNPQTCEQVVQTYRLNEGQRRHIRGAADSTAASNNRTTREGRRLAGAATSSVWMRSFWKDPINIDISSQFSGLKWNANGWESWKTGRDSFKGCLLGHCLDETFVVSESQTPQNTSTGATLTAKTEFQNNSFVKWVVAFTGLSGWLACGAPLSPKATFNHNTTLTGNHDGSTGYHWEDSKHGACTNLVRHDVAMGTDF